MVRLLENPGVSAIIIAIITGLFSLITLRIQKNQNTLISKIDEQGIFIEKEKAIRQKLVQAEKRRDQIIAQVTILSMKISIHLINTISTDVDKRIIDDLKQTSNELESSYRETSTVIKDISKEYDILISVSDTFQNEFNKMLNTKK